MSKSKTTQKKKISATEDPTKYYRAVYLNSRGIREGEVYIADTLDSARQYALECAHDRILESVEEFSELIEALL